MNNIDCVILWVDGSDPEWIKQRNKFSGKIDGKSEDGKIERYRDWGILKYLFRGIENFMPWIRNVYFVTCNQKPDWLNENNPKLKLINHADFMPAKYLPTFSSHPIEMNLHRIEGLSEQFVYFNDDMFVLRKTQEMDFFKNGLPCDSAVLNAIAMKKNNDEFRFLMPINDIEIINKYFDKTECIKKNWRKFYSIKYGMDVLRTICLRPWIHFTGFVNYHLPYSIKKSVLKEIWEKEPNILDETCLHRFRNSNDVNIWLVLYWQYASGQFYPRNPKIGHLACVSDGDSNKKVYEHIRKQKSKLLVINDVVKNADVDAVKASLIKAFEAILPNKSSFEM